MKRSWILGLVVVGIAGAAYGKGGNTREALRFTGKLAPAQVLRLRNLNGDVRVDAAAGDSVEIVATETRRDGSNAQVDVQVVTAKDGLVVCAVYPGAKAGRCEPDGGYDAGGGGGDDDHGLSVDFVVKLPKGVQVDAMTVNGGVEVHGATARVRAATVNGEIAVESSGAPVKAETVNGQVRARAGAGDVNLKSVNGSIFVQVPAAIDAEVRADVVHGSIDNDFGLRADGDFGPQTLRGKLGKGTYRLSAATVNGSISLRKN